MRSRLFVWAISAVVVPAASAVAQQPEVHTRQQIEQMVATFTEHYNKQDAAGIATMFTKDLCGSHRLRPPWDLRPLRRFSRHSSKPGTITLT